jgi:hypothetical protein
MSGMDVDAELFEPLQHVLDQCKPQRRRDTSFVRTLKGEDQAIQESVAKTQLMERRLEAVKKRADTIAGAGQCQVEGWRMPRNGKVRDVVLADEMTWAGST